jgi:hypothetical protein
MKKAFVFLGFLLLASPSWAADVGFNISIGAPGFYFSVGNFFGYPEREVVIIHERGIPDNDLAVVFFISQYAHVPPPVVIDLRIGHGWSWARICEYYRIPPAVFYIPVQSYGPPYGHAYGHYRHYPHQRDWERIRMTDAMIINQVNLIFISKYYNCPPERVIGLREQGSSFGTIERKVYRETEYKGRGGVPSQEMRTPGKPQDTRSPGTPSKEMRDTQRWKEIPSQGVRSPNAKFKDMYPSVSAPSQRPEVKGRYVSTEEKGQGRSQEGKGGYGSQEKGQGRGQGKKDKRDKD